MSPERCTKTQFSFKMNFHSLIKSFCNICCMLTTYQEHVRIGNKIMHKESMLPALLRVCIKESVCL